MINRSAEYISGWAFVVGPLSVSAGCPMALGMGRDSPAQRGLRMVPKPSACWGRLPPQMTRGCHMPLDWEGIFQLMEEKRVPELGLVMAGSALLELPGCPVSLGGGVSGPGGKRIHLLAAYCQGDSQWTLSPAVLSLGLPCNWWDWG